jgi:hypothetical protein
VRILSWAVIACSVLLLQCAGENKMISLPKGQPSKSERCEAPTWNVGDHWKFLVPGRGWWPETVIEVRNDLYITANPYADYFYGYDKKNLRRDVDLDFKTKRVVSQSKSHIYFDFPLYVGRKWREMSEGPTDVGTSSNRLCSYKVIGFEDVTVPAGTFKAFRIEMEESLLTPGTSMTCHVWYSPVVKNVIKFKYVGWMGNWAGPPPLDFELLSYELSPRTY